MLLFIHLLPRLIVVLRNQVHVFTFPNNPQKLFTLDTRDNPKGNHGNMNENCRSVSLKHYEK